MHCRLQDTAVSAAKLQSNDHNQQGQTKMIENKKTVLSWKANQHMRAGIVRLLDLVIHVRLQLLKVYGIR